MQDPLLPTDLDGQELALEAQNLAKQRRRERQIIDLRELMGTVIGRRVIWFLLADSHISPVACYRGADTHGTAHMLGRAARASEIWTLVLNHMPELYTQAAKEAADYLKLTNDDATRDTANAS